MLLGHKTRIDKTIAGLLQHQITVVQKLVLTIGQKHSTSRVPKTVPKFLRAVATRLSADIFAKVKKEWERFVNLMVNASCKRVAGSVSCWKVHCNNETFLCHDIDWTCTCLSYKSHRLPCRHIMHLGEFGHNFKVLPADTVHDRWSTYTALDVKRELAAAADLLKPILQISKLKSPKIKLPDDEHADERIGDQEVAPTQARKAKEVVYVRLYRKERANQVVLSSSEKYSYAKAMLEPLLEHLSCLSSADFYQELAAWRDTVEVGLNRSNADENKRDDTENDVDSDDESEEGVFSPLDPSDAMETVKLMDELENYVPVMDGCTDGDNESESEDKAPPTRISALQEDIRPSPRPPSNADLDKKGSDAGAYSKEEIKSEEQTPATPIRAVDIINISKPKRRRNSRVTTKQLRQTTLTSGPQRLAVHKYQSGLTVTLDQLLIWARNTANLKCVAEMLDRYPVQFEDAYLRGRSIECNWEAMRPADCMHSFVILVDLNRSLQAAITTARKEQRSPPELVDSVKAQGFVLDVVATIDPKLWKVSGQFVGALTGFHGIKTKWHMWAEDRKWLEQDWRRVASNVSLFAAVQTNTTGMSVDAACQRHRVMANEAISKFASSRLRTEFIPQSGGGAITFENMVGGLCRGWLNDSHVDFCLWTLGSMERGIHVISSMMWNIGWPSTLKVALGDIKFVLHPVNLDASHWAIIIIRLHNSGTVLLAQVYMYEPLINECCHDRMRTVWEGIPKVKNEGGKEGLRGNLKRWHAASLSNVKLLFQKVEWVFAP